MYLLLFVLNKVQFRLRQVVNAPLDDKEELLKSLEEFAFRGIPDINLVKERMDEASLAEAVRLRRSQQKELIDRLKSQLRELEQYAFDNGEAGVPQDVVVERQRAILNELKTRMNLEIDEQNYHQVIIKILGLTVILRGTFQRYNVNKSTFFWN